MTEHISEMRDSVSAGTTCVSTLLRSRSVLILKFSLEKVSHPTTLEKALAGYSMRANGRKITGIGRVLTVRLASRLLALGLVLPRPISKIVWDVRTLAIL